MDKNKPRIVIDTNVLISGIVFGGKPRQILDLLAKQSVIVIVAEEILTELRRKISTKFPDFIEDLNKVELLLKRDAVLIKLGEISINISRDPDDNKFIESAILGRCSFIITGDKDLLILKSYKNLNIIKPDEFLKLVSKLKVTG
ncbi:MAG TPA: putative toxin-antitoxin system toxin component, PIN family [Candidatus Dormibacteraeota bacterium]|nr:putative toxin-antitoxin system toxin component, PIN family [Candidatus Dormibacteraeota bacterium]